jgi:hypothetical protein
MGRPGRNSIVTVLFFCLPCATAFAGATENLCKTSPPTLPSRAANAQTGSAFASRLRGLTDDQREDAILSELLKGNIPQFLRRLAPVTLQGRASSGEELELTVCVAPNYVAVGSDDDFLFMPMRLRTALVFAQRYGFTLPTPKLVDAIYAQARIHFRPQPLPASDQMRTTRYYQHHDELVQEQRLELAAPLDELVAGNKKDLVLTNRLWTNPARVAIYGWHREDGRPIQPLSTVHGARYADYSHGIRLVLAKAFLNGEPQSLLALLQNAQTASLVSTEGPIRRVSDLVQMLEAQTVRPLTPVSYSSGSLSDNSHGYARP